MNKQYQTRRERIADETRKKIINSALEITMRKGVRHLTMKEVAKKADVAEGTIYNHFKDKSDLIAEMMNQAEESDNQAEILDKALDNDPHDFFMVYLKERFCTLRPHIQLLVSLLPEIMNNDSLRETFMKVHYSPGLERMENHLKTRMEKGQLKRMDAALAARIFNGVFAGLLVLQLMGDEKVKEALNSGDELTASIVSILFEGLKAP
ncbi:MAG: TetR/AcrR family transcriptional regulator [Clostridiaceae bacterium]